MKWASPSTFFMKWREDHYLETQCAHHAQQKLRNLLSSTGPGWLIGIGFCMAFLTSIPNKPHPHSQGHLRAHILSHKFDWTNPAHLHCSHPMALQIYAPYPPIYDEIFQRILWSPWNDPALDTLRVWIGCVATTHSQGYLLFTLTFLPTHRHTWSQVVPNLACSACSQYSPNIAKDILAMPPKLKTSLDLTNTHPKVNQ